MNSQQKHLWSSVRRISFQILGVNGLSVAILNYCHVQFPTKPFYLSRIYVLRNIWLWFNILFFHSDNIISLDIYFEDLSIDIIEQTPLYEIWALIG